MSIIVKAQVTEKSMRLAEHGQYTFEVTKSASKTEIAREVERLYSVSVEDVNTIHVAGKLKRRGRYLGQRADTKKAVVKVKAGQKIDAYSVGE